ncbi:MAG: hypothetical protein HQK49_12070 [Oligoflexia bacterium]|nr:hypothetical protein [Oligoflexia bacterium]
MNRNKINKWAIYAYKFFLTLFIFSATAIAIANVNVAANAVTDPYGENSFPYDSDLGGIDSPYSEKWQQVFSSTDSFPIKNSNSLLLDLRCITTADNDLFIGVEQRMDINAPISKVFSIISDFKNYQNLFPGFKDIHIVSNDRNRYLLHWEQIIPIFFIPNIKYEMIYQINPIPITTTATVTTTTTTIAVATKSASKTESTTTTNTSEKKSWLFRYQLKNRGTILNSDGFIYIREKDANTTEYWEQDYFDAKWGVAKVLGKDRIWKDAVTDLAISDFAIKIKAENPDKEYKIIQQDAQKMAATAAENACNFNNK